MALTSDVKARDARRIPRPSGLPTPVSHLLVRVLRKLGRLLAFEAAWPSGNAIRQTTQSQVICSPSAQSRHTTSIGERGGCLPDA